MWKALLWLMFSENKVQQVCIFKQKILEISGIKIQQCLNCICLNRKMLNETFLERHSLDKELYYFTLRVIMSRWNVLSVM